MQEEIFGHHSQRAQLRQMVRSGRIGHALLLTGPDGIGKKLIAQELALELLGGTEETAERMAHGNHPDFHLIEPEGKSGLHTIDQIRQFKERIALKPHEAPCHFFLIDEAERMLPAAANALLKTLEEPTSEALFCLITSTPSSLLPTIRSRAAPLLFAPLTEAELIPWLHKRYPEHTQEQIAEASALSWGSAARAREEAEAPHLFPLLLRVLAHPGEYLLLHGAVAEIDGYLQEERRTQAEKKGEGVALLHLQRRVRHLFRRLATWYRDLHLLRSGIDYPPFHRGARWIQQLTTWPSPHLPPLEEILQILQKGEAAFLSNTKISTALEMVLLELTL